MALWILSGGTGATAGGRFGLALQSGNEARTLCLAVALTIYFVRLLFTQFVFLKRAMTWREAVMIGPWIFILYLAFSMACATNPAPPNVMSVVGAALFLIGSWMNTYSEYARYRWKQRPKNHDKLYTLGLFRYTRHPNYLGDLLSFTGLALITGRWLTLIIPLIMLGGFVFVNIPMLDSHLHDRYGYAFAEYARQTRKLIPFVY
jgi:steroid 5-alpha reductase family enzyme